MLITTSLLLNAVLTRKKFSAVGLAVSAVSTSASPLLRVSPGGLTSHHLDLAALDSKRDVTPRSNRGTVRFWAKRQFFLNGPQGNCLDVQSMSIAVFTILILTFTSDYINIIKYYVNT